MEGLVPNISELSVMKNHPRNGRSFLIHSINYKASKTATNIRDGSIYVHGTKLFNSLPTHLRNCTNCTVDEFKGVLDKFLKEVPDEPPVNRYPPWIQ